MQKWGLCLKKNTLVFKYCFRYKGSINFSEDLSRNWKSSIIGDHTLGANSRPRVCMQPRPCTIDTITQGLETSVWRHNFLWAPLVLALGRRGLWISEARFALTMSVNGGLSVPPDRSSDTLESWMVVNTTTANHCYCMNCFLFDINFYFLFYLK